MGIADILLELGLISLLLLTLVHCIRLQRTLAALRHDRAALNDAIAGFDTGTRQAEAGLTRLRAIAEDLATEASKAAVLREDIVLLSDRGDALADRLDSLVRAGRALAPPAPHPGTPPSAPGSIHPGSTLPDSMPTKLRSAAERNLMLALQGRR